MEEPTAGNADFILASASPRRAELLAGLGLSFQIVPSRFEERLDRRTDDPARLVSDLALGKAEEVARRLGRGLVLGADTVVVMDGLILGKPADSDNAGSMLHLLSGRWHEVYTGIALCDGPAGRRLTGCESTKVKFRRLSDEEIDAYVATGEPLDKAGAYGIQGFGAILVERIEGCYTNVVGLPLARLSVMLPEFGLAILAGGRNRMPTIR